MATAQGFIGDATGGIGQGLAFVLPQSNSERYAMQLAMQHGEDLRAQAQARYLAKQKAEEQYQQQILAQKLPDYWSKVGVNINDNYNKYLSDAATYHAKTGKTPFTNPEFVQRYNNEVLLPARQSKDLEKVYTDGLAKVASDNEGHYTEESKKAFTDWAAGFEKDPYAGLKNAPPQLAGTPSGMNDFTKLLKPVGVSSNNGYVSTTTPDSSAHKAQAYINAQDPRWNNLKASKYGIDPNIPDFGTYNNQGKRVFYTNPTATGYLADEILKDPSSPKNAQILQQIGLDTTDQFAREKLQAKIAQQNKGWGSFISDAAMDADAKVARKTEREFAGLNYDLALQREARERAKDAKGDKQTFAEPTYNVPGYVAQPGKIGQSAGNTAVTSPIEIDAGDIKGAVVPKEVFNPATGHFGANTTSRNITDAKIKMMPTVSFKNSKGQTVQQMLSDEQVAKAKDGKLNIDGHNVSYGEVSYPYMVYGSETVRQPVMEKVTKDGKTVDQPTGKFEYVKQPVAFDAKHLTDNKFNKNVNYDQYEIKLPTDIQLKVIRGRIKERYPELPDNDVNAAVADFYNARLKKYAQ